MNEDTSPLPRFSPRPAESHKGTFGRALLIGGSQGMAGSIALSGIACLRGGAGLVQLAVPAAVQSSVAGFEPSYMTTAVAQDANGRMAAGARETLEPLVSQATAVACGPGLGRSVDISSLVAWLYTTCAQPLVVDADGLNALADQPQLLEQATGPRVLTPHPGEFRRLVPAMAGESRQELEAAAVALAHRSGAVLLLKGTRTLITDGQRVTHNTTGNPGMATGGTGDVLTGLITALLCQGFSPYDAARLGAHLHGRAGDLARDELGEMALIASDLPRFLPRALREQSS